MPGRWLLLIHQIPPRPNYLRVKVGRRLARVGAVALKNTVYVLPRTDAAQEDFQWIRRELVASGGDATIFDAQLVDGLGDSEVESLFRDARDADYRGVIEEARAVARRFGGSKALGSERKRALEAEVVRLERRLQETAAIDFCGASSRETATGLVSGLRARATPLSPRARSGMTPVADLPGRTWVTRTGIAVDRIASAWLVRRFVDPDAQFKFVPAKGYVPAPGELRFDMFDAEFTHVGDACTFEVLRQHLGLSSPGLEAVAEIVHDIDLKDGKFARPEVAGVTAAVTGLTLANPEDSERLARGTELFDALLAHFARRAREEDNR